MGILCYVASGAATEKVTVSGTEAKIKVKEESV